MSATLSVEIAGEVIERVRAGVAVVGFFDADRPLRADAARADWRLCGHISRLLLAGKLCGAAGEALLISTGGALAAPWLLALGLGPRAGFDADACAAFGRDAVARAARLRASTLALGLPDAHAGDLVPAERLAALLSGAVSALAENSYDIRLCIVPPIGEAAPTRKAVAALAPHLRSPKVALRVEGAPALGRVRLPPQGEGGSSLHPRQGIK